jgi:Mce-associated membrane protein
MRLRKQAKPSAACDDAGSAAALGCPLEADAPDALTLAEAEATAAEAMAEAARARAKLLKLRREAGQNSAGTAESENGADADADADADAVSVPAQPVGQPRPGRTWGRIRWAVATLAVLGIGGFVAADVLLLVHHRGVEQRQRQLAEYAAAARQGVVTLMSLNYQTVDDDVKRIIENSAGDFKKDFESHAEDFTKVARESRTVTEVATTVSGVESMSDTEAVVLVAASTKVTNAAGARDEPRNWRLTVHLIREGGQVKMSKVDFAT